MLSNIHTVESLLREVKRAKNELIKASKLLLHELEQTPDADVPGSETAQQIAILDQRIDQLQEEVLQDYNNETNPIGFASATSILEAALAELQLRFDEEMNAFNQGSDNADKVLDMHFRIQEIKTSLKK